MSGALITIVAPDGVPEVRPGDDLATLLLAALDHSGLTLRDGDVVAVTSKVVSKAEGRLVSGTDRDRALPGETVRVVARRGPTTIVRNHLGLTMAAAGIDRSNLEPGTMSLLPVDPDASARGLRLALAERAGVNAAVVVTDTAGRAWRTGQTDLAIGAAGLVVLDDHGGRVDRYGNELAVTAPALADEIAGAAELSQGKLAARPFAVVRGRADLVLPPGEDGSGARSLNREEGADLFGYGAREAVIRALAGALAGAAPFGAPAPPEDLVEAVRVVLGVVPWPTASGAGAGEELVVPGPVDPRLAVLAFAHGWEPVPTDRESDGDEARLRPRTP